MVVDLAPMIEHTLLRAEATASDVMRLCDEACEHGFVGVCVLPRHVAVCARRLDGTGVSVVTVVGFPLGGDETEVKAVAAARAARAGAAELDMVLPVGALRDGDDAAVERDIGAVVEAAGSRPVKVILETACLRDDEKVRACAIAVRAGASYVKTSTGFGPGGATVRDVRLLKESVGPSMGVKASGGIRDAETARAMVEAGATRIGTSAGVSMVGSARTERLQERGY